MSARVSVSLRRSSHWTLNPEIGNPESELFPSFSLAIGRQGNSIHSNSLSLSLSVSLSVCLPVCLSPCLRVSLSVCVIIRPHPAEEVSNSKSHPPVEVSPAKSAHTSAKLNNNNNNNKKNIHTGRQRKMNNRHYKMKRISGVIAVAINSIRRPLPDSSE